MNIDELCELVDDYSEAYVIEARLVEDGAIGFRLRLDCSLHVQRAFEISAHNVLESDAKIGWCGYLDFSDDHPLAWDDGSPWFDLYYTSTPASADEVIGRIYETHQSIMQDWRPLSRYLNASASQLNQGNGLLASGPQPLIGQYSQSLNGLLRVNMVACHRVPKVVKALIIGDGFVTCSHVTVAELANNQD
jgi:hypothetical protein